MAYEPPPPDFQRQLDDLRRQLDERHATQQRQIENAMAATDVRFHTVNEFRGALSDQAATFLSRSEWNAAHALLENRVDAINDRVNLNDGANRGLIRGWGILVAAIAAIGTIVVIVNIIVGR